MSLIPAPKKLVWYGVGLLLVLFALNYLSGWLLGYPFVFCATSGILGHLIAPVAGLLMVVAALILVVLIVRRSGDLKMYFLAIFLAGITQFPSTLFLGSLGCTP